MNRTRWFDIGAIVLAVAVLVGLAVSSCSVGEVGSVATPTAAPSRPRAAADARPLALFIGDSYTAGDNSAEMSYSCRAAVEMRWLCALAPRIGTGYISGGPANRWVDPNAGRSLSFSERIPHLAAQYDPAVVLLDGGRNDGFAPREAVYAKMLSTIEEARSTWPKAQIVFIRPRFLANPAGDLGFDDKFMESLKSEPGTHGVVFIDPISRLAGTDTSTLLSTDGIHPNAEGEKQMTSLILKSLNSWIGRPVGSAL
jgi:lysophospholipase L1-like esterase